MTQAREIGVGGKDCGVHMTEGKREEERSREEEEEGRSRMLPEGRKGGREGGREGEA
jgi:hypothetical protein